MQRRASGAFRFRLTTMPAVCISDWLYFALSKPALQPEVRAVWEWEEKPPGHRQTNEQTRPKPSTTNGSQLLRTLIRARRARRRNRASAPPRGWTPSTERHAASAADTGAGSTPLEHRLRVGAPLIPGAGAGVLETSAPNRRAKCNGEAHRPDSEPAPSTRTENA